MNSFAKVKKHSIVLDPFVGSGGILIASSHKNAICFGSEFEKRILNNKGIFINFRFRICKFKKFLF